MNSRAQERSAAIHFILCTALWGSCALLWIALLTFDAGDWPSTSVWPNNSPPANWCSYVGAAIAWWLYYLLGIGALGVAVFVTGAVAAISQRIALPDAWLRVIGVAVVSVAVAVLGAIVVGPTGRFTIAGAGGLLGSTLSYFLQAQLRLVGTSIVLACSIIVGTVLAADQLVLNFVRWFIGTSRTAAPAILRGGGEAIAGMGAAVAAGVGNLSGRLATAAAGRNGQAESPAVAAAAEPVKAPRITRRGGSERLAADKTTAADSSKPEKLSPPPIDSSHDAATESAPPKMPLAKISRNGSAIASAVAAVPPVREEQPAKPATDDEFEDLSNLGLDERADAASSTDDDFDADSATADFEDEAPPPVEPTRAPSRGKALAADDEDDAGTARATQLELPGGGPLPPPRVTDMSARAAALIPKPTAPMGPTRIGNYVLPDLTQLEDPDIIDKSRIELRCREHAYILEQTLSEFRLEVQVVAIDTGPVITVFELRLSPGIKVSQIASLTNDIARALKAPAVRVVAPLPGKNTIGIEVPNLDKEKVRLKELIFAADARSERFEIPLCLGKDASGQPLVSDLTKMPHLLIAGTTGSGKSVCVGSIIMSILLTRTPEEVQLILTDPKVVELAMFKDIPHLMCPIVTDMARAEGILDWATTKMDERYALLAEAGVKDIRSYNKLGKDLLRERMQIETDEEMAQIPVKLPYIVIVIDELADLMMTAAKEVEFYLCRLAQKSRAVGIHLIVSTQRPQANVVTGLIKSNLPSRIAFRVSSRLDSRIVLDQNGAEVLMGQGDMLFLPPGSAKLVRAQGTYISDEELRSVVKHCRAQGEPQYHPELIRAPKSDAEAGERDELFDQAVDIILESGRGSVSLLQRRLTIGYGRASRLIDQMAAAGIVGDYKGSQAREVAMTREEWQALRNMRDREEAADGI